MAGMLFSRTLKEETSLTDLQNVAGCLLGAILGAILLWLESRAFLAFAACIASSSWQACSKPGASGLQACYVYGSAGHYLSFYIWL